MSSSSDAMAGTLHLAVGDGIEDSRHVRCCGYRRSVRSVPEDSRGIIDPAEMMRHVELARYPAGSELDGIIDWFWSVRWSLPEGAVHDQKVLNHPCGHVSVGTTDNSGVPLRPAQGRVYGLLTELSTRRLTVDGWTVAAKTTVGGMGALVSGTVHDIADRELSLSDGLTGFDGEAVVNDVIAASTLRSGVDVLRSALVEAVASRPPDRVAEARWVAAMATRAETDRAVCRTEHLAEVGGVSVRTLQRLFDRHVGIGPAWVIRRWRLIDAVEAARRADTDPIAWSGWSTVAAELGYSDQAHLIRDFRRHLGTTPARYMAALARN